MHKPKSTCTCARVHPTILHIGLNMVVASVTEWNFGFVRADVCSKCLFVSLVWVSSVPQESLTFYLYMYRTTNKSSRVVVVSRVVPRMVGPGWCRHWWQRLARRSQDCAGVTTMPGMPGPGISQRTQKRCLERRPSSKIPLQYCCQLNLFSDLVNLCNEAYTTAIKAKCFLQGHCSKTSFCYSLNVSDSLQRKSLQEELRNWSWFQI